MSSRATSEPVDKLIGAGFELRLSVRELVVDGVPAPLERMPFDALVYLIENRDKVVSRDELLERVWGTRYRSESVVARAITKLRQALGDLSDEPRLIKTIHRVGYRFIGEVGQGDAPRLGSAAVSPVLVERGRIAFLPVKVPPGEPELVWVEYGLAAIVANALTTAPGLQPVPMGDTIVSLGNTDPTLAPERKAELLCARLGADAVLAISVQRHATAYRLSWRLFGQRQYVGDDILGSELTRMATVLGERAAAYLQPTFLGRAALRQTGDAFVDEAFARASSAMALEHLDEAWKLLRICSINGSAPLHVQTAQVHLMAMRNDPATLREGPAIFERTLSRSDTGAQVTVLVALARYCALSGRLEEADGYVRRAMQLTENVDEPLIRSTVLMSAAIVARHRRDYKRGRELCDELRHLAPRLPLIKQMRNLMTSANAYADAGRIEEAIVEVRRALLLARELGIQYNLRVALLNLALFLKADGRPSEARLYAEEAVRDPALLGAPLRIGFSIVWIYVCTSVAPSEVRDAQAKLDHVAATLDAIEARGAWNDFLIFFRALATWRLGHHEQAFAEVQTAKLESLAAESFEPLALVRLYWGIIAGSAQRWDLVSAFAERLLSASRWRDATTHPTDLDAIPELLRAMADHAAGDAAHARTRLHDVIARIAPGILRGQALLCAVWLAAEAGALSEARVLAAQAGSWLTGNPIGQLVHARLELADGAHELAAQTISAALAGLASAGPAYDYFQSLSTCALTLDRSPPSLPNLAWLV